MGAVGTITDNSYKIDLSRSIISNYGHGDGDILSNYLTNLGRPLKQSEFTFKQEYIGSQLQGGAQYGYRIIPPKGFPFMVYSRTVTKAGAKDLVKRFVHHYNAWYDKNKK